MSKTYTFIWQQPEGTDNPLELWAQKASFEAASLVDAWHCLLDEFGDREWSPQCGQFILVISGDLHTFEWRRVVPVKPLRTLSERM